MKNEEYLLLREAQTHKKAMREEKVCKEKTDIDQRNKEQKNKGRMCEYLFKEPEPLCVAEAMAKYAATKRQGEYTVEDYLALPEEQRVELIDGVIYDMAAPTYIHQAAAYMICRFFEEYIRKQHGVCRAVVAPVDVQLDCDDRTIVQPDVMIVCDRSKFRKGRIYGAPDLIVEVLSPSTSKKDRTLKLSKYKNAGVREYWLVDTEKKKVLVYHLENGDSFAIYGFSDAVPVGIYGGDCKVDFKEVDSWIGFMYDTM
ncbi:MAG: Uma2 family endonuclease [Lachnospiraceae bacterium]|nr:Uma2 family endonuclease [Lachnospiraceae bacterium]